MRSYAERRALLVEVLEPLGPPLQVVPSVRNRAVAAEWYTVLRAQGLEGLVWKHATSLYAGGRRNWRKQRYADTIDGVVVRFTGPQTRPHTVAVRLPDGSVAFSQRLPAVLAAALGTQLTGRACASSAGLRVGRSAVSSRRGRRSRSSRARADTESSR